jgi:chemotaxis protein MotB
MMAFFMVMWIVGLDDRTRKEIEQYFTHSVGFTQGHSGGMNPVGAGPSPVAAADARLRQLVHKIEAENFRATGERLRARLDSLNSSLGSALVEVTVTESGPRIELIDAGTGAQFFPRGSATPRPVAVEALAVVASELALLQNAVIVEGHTDGAPYSDGANYTNWELSADRANAARRILQSTGVNGGRIAEVRGLADTRPRNAADPMAAENRRISIILPFTAPVAAVVPRSD